MDTIAAVGMQLILIWSNGRAGWMQYVMKAGQEAHVPISIPSFSKLQLKNALNLRSIQGNLNEPAGTVFETRRDGASISFRGHGHDISLDRLPARLRVTVVSIGETRPARPQRRHGYFGY